MHHRRRRADRPKCAPWQLYPASCWSGSAGRPCRRPASPAVAPWFRSATRSLDHARHHGRKRWRDRRRAAAARLGTSASARDSASPPSRLGVRAAAALIAWVLRFRGPADLGCGATAMQRRMAMRRRQNRPVATPVIDVLLWSAAAGFALDLTVRIGFITHHLCPGRARRQVPSRRHARQRNGVTTPSDAASCWRASSIRVDHAATGRHHHRAGANGGAGPRSRLTLRHRADRRQPDLQLASGHVTTLGPIVVRRSSAPPLSAPPAAAP